MDDRLLTPDELAEKLRVSPRTLTQWRYLRKGPTWIRVGHRSVRYPIRSLEEWLSARSNSGEN
jgi:hypothetical protein